MTLNFDPEKLAHMVEKYLGLRWGRLLIQVAIFCGLVGLIALGLKWFLKDLIGEVVWPFFVNLFGSPGGGITLDNIEAVIVTLVVTIGVLLFVMVGTFLVLVSVIRRRVVPQAAIDALAKLRSDGISILNDLPSKIGGIGQWESKWNAWAQSVIGTLDANYTKAESLSFSRLGVIKEAPLSFAESPEHNHKLMMLSKQLSILEGLIQRHQERR